MIINYKNFFGEKMNSTTEVLQQNNIVIVFVHVISGHSENAIIQRANGELIMKLYSYFTSKKNYAWCIF